jgi:hypothetical protein
VSLLLARTIPSGGVTGVVNAAMPPAVLVALGNSTVSGTVSASTPLATLVAIGSPRIRGAGAATTPLATLVAIGSPRIRGAGASTTPLATLVALGNSTVLGSVSAVTPLATLSATGGPRSNNYASPGEFSIVIIAFGPSVANSAVATASVSTPGSLTNTTVDSSTGVVTVPSTNTKVSV